MRVIYSGDWHCNPVMTSERYEAIFQHASYLREQQRLGAYIVLGGDISDKLEFPEYDMPADLKGLISTFIELPGNHDPDRNLKDHLVIGGCYFCHGHQFDWLFWRWARLRYFPLPKFIVNLYKTPAQKKGSLLDYHLATIHCEYQAMKFCVKHGYKGVIFGHTHSPLILDREGYKLVNYGDWCDSFTWVEGETMTDKWELCHR